MLQVALQLLRLGEQALVPAEVDALQQRLRPRLVARAARLVPLFGGGGEGEQWWSWWQRRWWMRW